jgi:hypothetical protein
MLRLRKEMKMVVLNDDDAVVVVSFIDDGNYDLYVRHNQTNNNEPCRNNIEVEGK